MFLKCIAKFRFWLKLEGSWEDVLPFKLVSMLTLTYNQTSGSYLQKLFIFDTQWVTVLGSVAQKATLDKIENTNL